MKKYLLTLLCVAYVLNSLAGTDSVSVLETEKITLDGYHSIPQYITVLTSDASNAIWSPCFQFDDKENKIYRIKGVNENGIVDIAEIKYKTDNINMRHICQDGYPSEHGGPGLCFRPQLDYLNSSVLDEKINVDFNYLFYCYSYNGSEYNNSVYQLVNERGDVIYTFPSASLMHDIFYSEDLFYISYLYETGEYPNYTTEVINLASLLKDYSTKVANAKADAVNSKSTKTYNIQGMEVDDDAKGIVIENGAKYIKE